ncbi:MAG TPA: hypothetical protein VL095_11460 [Flavisolibacter sp.]|nr:hypothetical protein [Flavisolibacter sp.]
MRILLLLFVLTSSLLLGAQTVKQGFKDSGYIQPRQSNKWFVTSYSNLGVGVNFINGNRATLASAPVGLKLNRRLNDNLYAFTGFSLAPTYVNFSRPLLSPGIKSFTGNDFKSNYFGLYPSLDMGLMYVNDAKTFSISGSIGVQRSDYPVLLYSPATIQRLNNFTPTHVYR